jgi:hypothetical protein
VEFDGHDAEGHDAESTFVTLVAAEADPPRMER